MAKIQEPFKLKLATGKIVECVGKDGKDAARRYVDMHQTETVVAFKPIVHGLFVLGNGVIKG